MNQKIKETNENYSKMLYKEALRTGFYEFQAIRDKYLQLSAIDGINWTLIMRYIELQIILLSPICPHICEYIWEFIGKVSKVGFYINVYRLLLLLFYVEMCDLLGWEYTKCRVAHNRRNKRNFDKIIPISNGCCSFL